MARGGNCGPRHGFASGRRSSAHGRGWTCVGQVRPREYRGRRAEAGLATQDRRLSLEFRALKVTSDAGPLAFRELDGALGLTDLAGRVLADRRTSRNSRHTVTAQFRPSVFGRFTGYEGVSDTDRLGHNAATSAMIRRCAGSAAAGR